MKRIFTLLTFSFLGFFANAQFVENFSYTSTGTPANDTLTNPSIGGAIWKKHSGAFLTNYIKFVTPGLTYSGYAGSNLGGAITMSHYATSAEDLNAAVGPFTTDSVYCSFILNVTTSGGTTGDYNVSFGATAGTSVADLKGRIFFKDGSTPNTFNIGVSKAGAAAAATFTTNDYPVGTPVLVVLKYKIVSGTTNDVASAYVFTSGVPATEPSAPTITAPDNTTGTDLGATGVASICIRQGNVGLGACTVDGFRVSNGWYNSPMPLSLKSFNASLINNKVALIWNTTNEINVDGFSIEKSNDGRTFNAIGFVAAKNASSASYSYNDVLASGVNYYRLKITDKDASIKYSSIVAINNKQSTKLEVYPNPVTNTATLTHEIATTKATIKVVTVDGKNVYTQNLQAGSTQTSFDVSKLLKGNYVVVFENGTTRTSLQFVKQ